MHPRAAPDHDAADQALLAELTRHDRPELTLDQLAERTGVGRPVLESLERAGLLLPDRGGDEPRYTEADVRAVAAGLTLLEAGLPLAELLDLGRRATDALTGLAEEAVEVFLRFVRDPARATTGSDDEAADQLVAAFRTMLPATEQLVALHFRRLLIDRAGARWSQGA